MIQRVAASRDLSARTLGDFASSADDFMAQGRSVQIEGIAKDLR